jgi:SAM-dependent methyltransferase
MAKIDYGGLAAGFERGRALPAGAFGAWHTAIAPRLAPLAPRRILDLGSGTGMWSERLATWFDADVVGVEPSASMRDIARAAHAHPRVTYVAGTGEALPIQDDTVDAAWLCTVIHHIPDLDACARHLRRVVRHGGRILIRSAFPDGLTDLGAHGVFFPGAYRVIESFPSIVATCETFKTVGFGLIGSESVAQESTPSLAAYLERVRTRADTTLALLSDEEFERGIDQLEAAVFRERSPEPVIHHIGLLVFE